ncbi:MAG: NAD(P)H-hydrate epimerase [Actinobacteria bacterium HGW-Actinobacteria-4]|nr:MAG: NAD(P)H-hydrate epimerase [Actinobacteria bacterium HGW-Actinobacteria-4]
MATTWSERAFGAEAIGDAEVAALAHATNAELMDRAAHAVARETLAELRAHHGHARGRAVVLLVGSGKNGGDALLAGVYLMRAGVNVDAVMCSPDTYEPAFAAFAAAGGGVHRAHEAPGLASGAQALEASDAVIDGVVGLGARPGLREPAITLAQAVPSRAIVIAVDLASGVDVATGETPGDFIAADVTVTFSAPKPCHFLPPAAVASGRVAVATVGVPLDVAAATPDLSRATAADVRQRWPMPRRGDHKYTRGVLGVVAGSVQYPGAAVLAVSGAWRTGVGMVRYWGPARAQDLVLAARPETVCHDLPHDAQVQAWLVGPGVAGDDDQPAAVMLALESGLPGVADAGAIEACVLHQRDHATTSPGQRPHWVVTPHAGELAHALTSLGAPASRADVESQPVVHARRLAELAKVVVLLKGAVTLICDPTGSVVSQADAPAWLATAGAGDVLAGVIGSLLASGVDPVEAAVMGAYVHANAARAASLGGPIVALDVAEAIPRVVRALLATTT